MADKAGLENENFFFWPKKVILDLVITTLHLVISILKDKSFQKTSRLRFWASEYVTRLLWHNIQHDIIWSCPSVVTVFWLSKTWGSDMYIPSCNTSFWTLNSPRFWVQIQFIINGMRYAPRTEIDCRQCDKLYIARLKTMNKCMWSYKRITQTVRMAQDTLLHTHYTPHILPSACASHTAAPNMLFPFVCVVHSRVYPSWRFGARTHCIFVGTEWWCLTSKLLFVCDNIKTCDFGLIILVSSFHSRWNQKQSVFKQVFQILIFVHLMSICSQHYTQTTHITKKNYCMWSSVPITTVASLSFSIYIYFKLSFFLWFSMFSLPQLVNKKKSSKKN